MSSRSMKRHAPLFSLAGFLLGIGAPAGWIVLRLVLFPVPGEPFVEQMLGDILRSGEQTALYAYMGIGTALVLAFLGFMIGSHGDERRKRSAELDRLHREVASQKDLFQNRYQVLDNNIKNFHHISSKIQTSLNLEEILLLCAEGLHEILGYERVNILMTQQGERIRFVTATGTDSFDITGVTLPLNPSIGVIYKCLSEKKVFLIDDITRYPQDYQIQEPHRRQAPLRSRSFILCPIVVKGEAIGAFGIDNKTSRRALNDSDVDTIMLFADQVASAITRINLLTSIDALTSELENSFAFLLGSRREYSRNVAELKEAVASVAEGSAAIASASEGVMASVDETGMAVNEISVAIEQVTRNLDHLAGIAQQSAAAMEGITRAINNVEQNATVSHQVSSQVKSRADQSFSVVTETIDSLAEIQSSVELSYRAINHLAENSARIENVVSVINDITKRTNLLAFNAAIIAAQAGEYGKSFAVVADEIRNLSLQTGHSTGEITAIVGEILSESRAAADTITASKQLVQRGVELGHSTGEALRAIHDSSACSMDMTQKIKRATREQVDSMRIVASSMEEISSMTSQILSASTAQAKATRSIVRSVETIKEMAHEMVDSTSRQVRDGNQIRHSVESVSDMVREMFDNMEQRRAQSAEVVRDLESMKNLTCQL